MASYDPVSLESMNSTKSSYELSDAVSCKEESSEDDVSATILSLSERVKLRCSPRRRWVSSRGAILVLLLSCLIANSFGPLFHITAGILRLQSTNENLVSIVHGVIEGLSFALLYPLAGWIADIYFGRYKVIHASLQLMWAGVVAILVCLCIEFGTGIELKPLHYSILPIALIAIQCGIAGFKANAIPFGTDQLVEGSSNELSAYIHWYAFTVGVNIRVLSLPFSCFVKDPDNVLLLHLLVQAACLSLALCLDFCLKGWLIIEPKTNNPFKTIYQVLNYARKNKRPKFRSAFTYHVESIPSRMEFCKPQYGGPFTIEEVENVKTFLRMLVVLIPMGLTVLLGIVANKSVSILAQDIHSDLNCVTKAILSNNFPVFLGVLLLPIHELVLYPFLHRFMPSMLVRGGIGTVFVMASFLAQLAIDTVGHLHTDVTAESVFNSTNHTASTCIFASDSGDLRINYDWIVLPGALLAIGVVLQLVATYEFVFAQSPYSMKGLFIGLSYGVNGFFGLVTLILQLPFLLGVADTSQVFPACGFFFFLMNIVITAISLVWYSCAAWKYKKREREPPESHYAFAEEYYGKYLKSKELVT